MTIRNKILAIRGKPKPRAAVRVNSQAAADELRHRWAVENALRTLNARVLYLAEQLDRLAARKRRTG
jgi:hypothetical protein